uniref:Putative acyl carrier protein (ACP) n=1 Tax=Streptomyces tendae TaxID=1932 RepID=A7DWI7_STRTE|nr:putative acyl carrier protein (ACP) [Streptomyces tendae]
MSSFTLEDLRAIMRDSIGVDESVDLTGAQADTDFGTLGYDSLAVLELAGRIQRMHGIPLADDDLLTASTPREVVALVNRHTTEAGI